MATIDLSVTLSASDQTRVVASWQIEANADLNAGATPAQVLTYIKKWIRTQLAARVVSSEYATNVAAVAQPNPPSLT